MKFSMYKRSSLVEQHFSFKHWNLNRTVKKTPCRSGYSHHYNLKERNDVIDVLLLDKDGCNLYKTICAFLTGPLPRKTFYMFWSNLKIQNIRGVWKWKYSKILRCKSSEMFESENIQNVKKCEFEWKPESTGAEGATHSVSVKVSWVDQTLC